MLDRLQTSLEKYANGHTIFVLFIVLIVFWSTLRNEN
jgi:hypothetical protein